MIEMLKPVEYAAQIIMTTEQLAQFYETDVKRISENFNRNFEHFVEGKHFFKVEGEELNKLRSANCGLQISPMTRTLYLWTKRGAARHAKMLGTEKAWDVFELLEENYFSAKKSSLMLKPSEVVSEIGLARDSIKKVFGVKEGIALAQATSLVEEFFGKDLTQLKVLIPAAQDEVGTLTPTAIGEKLGGISGRKINKKLVAKGFQVKDGNGYKLTEEGKQYGELMPFVRNGHSGYQICWNEKILKVLR